MKSRIKKFIGPKVFYQQVLRIALPLAIQNFMVSSMGLIDTIMVSWIGQVSAVGTASRIEDLLITVNFGVVAGIGIYCAQFYGGQQLDKLKKSFGLSVFLSFVGALIWMAAVLFAGPQMMRFFINDQQVILVASEYLTIVVWSYIPLALTFAFSFVYRGIQKTTVPMIIGLIAMFTNMTLNYVLIFGKFGFPQLGVSGAAYGTLVAQWVSFILHVGYAKGSKQPFFGTFSEMFNLDLGFVKPILKRTMPLIINEIMFGFGYSLYIKAYGLLGSVAIGAYYIATKIEALFFFVVQGLGSSAGSILGNQLGGGKTVEAQESSRYFIGLAGALAVIMIVIIVGLSPVLVRLFGITDGLVYSLAVGLVMVSALRISSRLFNAFFFAVLRAGGDAKFISFLDAGIMWLVGLPLAYGAVLLWGVKSIVLVYLIVQIEQLVRIIIGMQRYRSNKWIRNLTMEVI
jgi:putative MATE family efflux protein